MMRGILLGALWIAPAFAEADLCPMTDDQSNCVRLLACIGDQGRWFHGRAFGRGEGTLSGVVNDGVACVGNWVSRNAMGLGQADVFCEDGMEATVLYSYQDEYTGTALGHGRSTAGAKISAWTGLNVLDYLREESGEDTPSLPCPAGAIPLV